MHFGTALTASTLDNCEKFASEPGTEFQRAIAAETEGPGVYEAATEDNKPDWIMVKAIRGWGWYGKNDDKQSLAARNVTDFGIRVIASGAARRRPSAR